MDTSLKWGLPLALGILGEEGERAYEEIPRHKQKRIQGKMSRKREYGVGRMTLSMLGKGLLL